jgi:hypothetical protein
VEIHEGYTEPLNLFVAAVLESGNRKTAVVNAARQPLAEFEREEKERIEPERRRAIGDRKTQEARIETLRKQVIDAGKRELRQELDELEQSLITIPELPRLWTQDVTPEALAALTANNGERMAVLSDEGGYFDILGGRYSRGIPNLDFVLQAHAGAPSRVDRKSGEPISLDKPLLTIGLSPQPAVLSGLSKVPGFRGRGLLARFLFGIPQSNLGYRKLEPRPIPRPIERDYSQVIRSLLEMRNATDNARPIPIKLTFAPFTYNLWREFQQRVEVQMREGNQLAGLKDWAGKLPGAVARIAGVLHCATHSPLTASTIGRDTMESALTLGSIFISHAIAAFGLMSADENADRAKRIIRWAIDRAGAKFTVRDAFCAFQSTFENMDNLEPVLRLLIDHHYVRITDEHGKTRRSSRVVRLNPALMEA